MLSLLNESLLIDEEALLIDLSVNLIKNIWFLFIDKTNKQNKMNSVLLLFPEEEPKGMRPMVNQYKLVSDSQVNLPISEDYPIFCLLFILLFPLH